MQGGGSSFIAKSLNSHGGRFDSETETFITHSLRGVGHDASEDGTGRGVPLLPSKGVRRLTPRECERLQGFADDHTLITFKKKPAADSPRYEGVGNSMARPVMLWIGQRIQQVEDLTSV